MDLDAQALPSGLLAVRGLPAAALQQLCNDFALAIAIRNDLDSVVLGGPRAALGPAAEAALRRGGHCTPLNVQVASYTPAMAGAAMAFAALNATLPFKAPSMLLFSNAAGRVIGAGQAKAALAHQIDHTVCWDDCMESIAARRVDCVLEVGPGQTLARMWNQR